MTSFVQVSHHVPKWACYLSGVFLAAIVLSGCSNIPSVFNKNKLTYVNLEPIVVSTNSEIPPAASVARVALNMSYDQNQIIDLEQVNALAGSKSLSNYRPDRAYAIGYPKQCGGSWHSWNYRGNYLAATKALSGCLSLREGFDEHTDVSCSCRLVVLNKTVLGNPSEFDFKRRTPLTMYFRPRGAGEAEVMKGMAETSGDVGSNMPMRVFNYHGKQMCSGSYSISMLEAALSAGSFSLKCFDEGTVVNGELRIKRIANPRGSGTIHVAVGTADISSGGKIAFISGIPYALARKHPELIENASQ